VRKQKCLGSEAWLATEAQQVAAALSTVYVERLLSYKTTEEKAFFPSQDDENKKKIR